MENCPAVTFVQSFLKNSNPFIFLAIVLCISCLIVICDFVQIKFVRHFESIKRNTWCKLKLLDIFCGTTAGFAYRRTSDFAFKNARRGIFHKLHFTVQDHSIFQKFLFVSVFRFLRSICHREFTRLVHGPLGNRRIPLPACAYTAIRNKFPVVDKESFIGYSDDSD